MHNYMKYAVTRRWRVNLYAHGYRTRVDVWAHRTVPLTNPLTGVRCRRHALAPRRPAVTRCRLPRSRHPVLVDVHDVHERARPSRIISDEREWTRVRARPTFSNRLGDERNDIVA